MKKRIILLFFVFIVNNINALPQIGLVPANIGFNISSNDGSNIEFDISLLYYSFEFDFYSDKIINTGLGITWIPVNYKYILKNHYWNFINFQLFWNLFALIGEKNPDKINNIDLLIDGSICGPFILINYAPNINWDKYILSYGLRYNFTGIMENNRRLYFFNIECGFRNIDNKNYFYFNVGIDLVFTSFLAIFHILNGSSGNIVENSKR